jgi:hypothetical protein
MTKAKQPKPGTTEKQPGKTGELSDAALNQVTGAMLACMPTDQSSQTGGSARAAGDGSVKTIGALIGLPKVGGN